LSSLLFGFSFARGDRQTEHVSWLQCDEDEEEQEEDGVGERALDNFKEKLVDRDGDVSGNRMGLGVENKASET